MGLDMYVFKAHPPKDDPNVVYKYKEMLDKGYSIFPDEDIEDESVRILKEYAVPFNLSVKKFDLKKISATYHLKNNITTLYKHCPYFKTQMGIQISLPQKMDMHLLFQ